MEHAKRMALKLFNYQFLNSDGYVKTANLLKYFVRIVKKPGSARLETMDIWPTIVNQWAAHFMKMKLRTLITRRDYYDRTKIMSVYRENFDYFFGKLFITIDSRIPSTYPETNFQTVKLIYEDYASFKRQLLMTRKYDLNEQPVKEAEVIMPPIQPIEELPFTVETKEVPKKYTKPYQAFHYVIKTKKGHKGFYKEMSFE